MHVGRPPTHDWDAVEVEVRRRCHYDGLPATQAELGREIASFMERTYGRAPELRTIERVVHRRFWPIVEELRQPSKLKPT